jgi:hypothetical protein
MRLAKSWFRNCICLASLLFLLPYPTPLFGQAGQNAVMQGTPTNSFAFIDASAYEKSKKDICATIQDILTFYKGVNGIVVDARGITTQLTCSTGESPWPLVGSGPVSNVVLLPAATITISSTWTLPQATRLIGEGPGATIIQASGFTGDIIDMGGTSSCLLNTSGVYDCTNVGIEHLRLDGGGIANLNGIVNKFSEELSYVDDVALTNIGGTGLLLGVYPKDNNGYRASAVNSGPYSKILFSGSGTCAQIVGQVVPNSGFPLGLGTRGIHGLTCITTNPSGAAVYLDGSNNSLEDVSITFQVITQGAAPDGVLVGSQNSAQNNVLANISGSALANVIHISSNNNYALYNCPTNACDITVLGVSNGGGSTNTVKDDLTGTTIMDTTVAMYVVGEQVIGGTSPAYSRFSSSPSFSSWFVGTIPPTTPCATGSLYSCTGGSSCTTGTILGCAGGTTWKKIL